MKADEQALLAAVFDRRAGAFESLLERYRALIYSVFHGPSFRFPRDTMDDLYQAFVVALSKQDYRKLRAFEGRNACTLATFLQVVATRFALDEQRKWQRHPRGIGGSEDASEPLVDREDPQSPKPLETTLQREQLDIFHNLLFLIDWKRVSAVLWVLRGVRRETIAEVMKTSRANIDALYKRAKDQMHELYTQGAGTSRTREADPEVLTPALRRALIPLLTVPTRDLHQALLQPGALRRAVLGLLLVEYPHFLCTRAELERVAGDEPVHEASLEILRDLAARLGRPQ